MRPRWNSIQGNPSVFKLLIQPTFRTHQPASARIEVPQIICALCPSPSARDAIIYAKVAYDTGAHVPIFFVIASILNTSPGSILRTRMF